MVWQAANCASSILPCVHPDALWVLPSTLGRQLLAIWLQWNDVVPGPSALCVSLWDWIRPLSSAEVCYIREEELLYDQRSVLSCYCTLLSLTWLYSNTLQAHPQQQCQLWQAPLHLARSSTCCTYSLGHPASHHARDLVTPARAGNVSVWCIW
jgi:hypothetical protein